MEDDFKDFYDFMISTEQRRLPFVIFQLKGNLYGIASQNICEIVTIPQVTNIPRAAPEVRGVINLRGKIIKLVDLRVKLGLSPLKTDMDTLIQLLHDREQDHRNWLAELEACVLEHRPFKLARDPHQCKFGVWYDQYKTEDRLLTMTLPSMDAPHKAIHAIAHEVLRLAENGDTDSALKLISHRRNHELAALVKLFEESRRILTNGCREVAIVMTRGENFLAFSADRVETAEHIPDENIDSMTSAMAFLNGGFYCRVAKRVKTNQTILLLNEDFLFSMRG